MKGTCLSCHRIILKSRVKQIYAGQLKLLEHGFLTEADILVSEYSNRFKHKEDQDVENYISQVLKGMPLLLITYQ